MSIIVNNKRKWENRHRIFNDPIKNMYTLFNGAGNALEAYNAVTVEIMDLIQKAENQGHTLRALGAGWSWQQIMTGGNKGIILDTKPLNSIFDMSAASLSTSYTKPADKLKFVQCGAGIWEINRVLKSKNLSLKTTGASNGQTIAGLISTGAHGSAIDVGAAQDFVVGLHIVVGANKHVYLERASYAVINDKFAKKLNTSIVANDDLFNAALVSFGSFGFIHGVMVEVEDLFLLKGAMRQQKFDPKLLQLMQDFEFDAADSPGLSRPYTRPYHFEVKINPYDPDKLAYVTTMYKEQFATGYTPPKANAEGIGPGDDAPAFIGKIFGTAPSLVPKMVNLLTKSSLTLYEEPEATGTIGEIFNNTALRGKLLSAAVGLRPIDIEKVLDILNTELENDKHGNFPGLFAFRFVKGTQATLGFTKFPVTCIMEMDGAFNDRSLNFCKAVWNKLQSENIPFTCHWGKQTDLSPQRLMYMYGADPINSWKKARKELLSEKALAVFNNPIMQQWGLD